MIKAIAPWLVFAAAGPVILLYFWKLWTLYLLVVQIKTTPPINGDQAQSIGQIPRSSGLWLPWEPLSKLVSDPRALRDPRVQKLQRDCAVLHYAGIALILIVPVLSRLIVPLI
ncbi:MAG: hypothetical protein ACXWKM_14265 [Phenylobacterium sp.]